MYTSSMLKPLLDLDLPNCGPYLTSDMTISDARNLSLRNSFLKKFQDEIDTGANERCLALFIEINERCKGFSLRPKDSFEDTVVGEVQSSLYDSFVKNGTDLHPTLSRFAAECGVGPGANLKSESYDFYTKLYNSPLSRTSSLLYRHYRYAIIEHPHWLHAELTRGALCGDIIVPGSNLTFVPKTSYISRTVCTEPTLNMLFQKWVGSYLESELRGRFKIDLSFQPELNRDLARRGSIDQSFGTIDLSSASDSISCSLVRALFPKHFADLLMQTRSPVTRLPGGESVELGMISSMGNGFTFPLQTLIFANLVVACYRVLGIKTEYTPKGPANFAVFGDDIIVRRDAYDFVVRCLEMFGFKVNVDKSFNVGNFRESCGGDFFRGFDIRGVYIKSLKTRPLVYSATNRLIRWSAQSGTPLLNTVSYLLSGLDPKKICYIPYKDGDSEGLKVPQCLARGTVWHKTTFSLKYRAEVSVAKSYSVKDSDDSLTHNASKLPGFRFNKSGLLIAFVGGYIRHGRVAVRSDESLTKVRWRYSSNWDYQPSPGASQDCSWYITVVQHLTTAGFGG